MLNRRIHNELELIRRNPSEHFSVGLIEEADFFHWEAIVKGPIGSPYEGGNFSLRIELPSEYPFSPPKVQFMTKIFHPNICTSGYLCLTESDWSSAMTITNLILSIVALLNDPDPDVTKPNSAARLFEKNYLKYLTTAKIWTRRYAM